MAEDRFLARWSRLKSQAQAAPLPGTDPSGGTVAGEPPGVERPSAAPANNPAAVHAEPPTSASSVPSGGASEAPELTLADVARLTRESDFAPFVAGGVKPDVRNAALKKLFSDPHFNVMDGLDVYIADYNAPDPLPKHALLEMAQTRFLGFLKTEAEQLCAGDAAPASAAPEVGANSGSVTLPAPADRTATAANEDTDLQLQPHDAAGRAGPDPGAGENGGREH